MSKSTFKFVFPKISKEYEVLVNPSFIEAAAVTALAQESTDLVQVFHGDSVLLICMFDDKDEKKYRFYYEQKQENHEVILMISDDETICDLENDTIEEFMEEHESSDYHLVYEEFSSSEEASAFMKGIEEFMDGHLHEYTAITTEVYDTLYNRNDG